ncbi:hypothetical protein [Hydrogenophaga sp. RWCD_12]|uniref:hypothetical protein n=1 Tax=Hydrogenophaga sp. RWCD_12 TaxID=3391190 RepID=UPI003985319A
MFAGRPDWHAPTHWAGRPVHAVFEQPRRFMAAPQRLRTTSFRLDIYEQDRGDAGLENFSLLQLGFEADFDLDAVRQAAPDAQDGLSALPAEAAWLRLHAADALSLPPEVMALQPLDMAGLGAMGLALRLDAASTSLLEGALQTGLLAVGAQAWVRVRGVAERWPLTLAFDPAALRVALQAPECPLTALREQLLNAPEALGFAALQDVPLSQRAQATEALLDRLVERFGTLQPATADSASDGIQLVFDAERMPQGQVNWNLAEPLLCPRLLVIEADPLAPLRELAPGRWNGQLVRRHSVPALGSGWHTITVLPNLPGPRAGLLRTQLELVAPPHPPARPFSSHASAPLPADDAPFTVNLRLAPDEPLHYQWKTSAFVLNGTRPELMQGTLQTADQRHLVVGPDALGLRLMCVEVDPALLREAQVEVTCQGQRNGKAWTVRGQVDRDRRRLALALPADLQDGTVTATATATSLTDSRQCTAPPQPIPDSGVYLDPFSFEGSGARSLSLACEFDDDTPQVLIELAPEDRTDETSRRTLRRLTPAAPATDWSWTALSPFRSGYRWRWAGQSDWSAALSPAQALQLRSSQAPTRSTP